MTRALAEACARVVEATGGGPDDLEDLLDVHRRVERQAGPRADRMRAAAATAPCRCFDGGVGGRGGRCGRCFGRRP